MSTITIELDDAIAEALGRAAEKRNMPVATFAAELLELVAALQDQDDDLGPLSDEDVAAIREGLAQSASGQVSSRAEVEARLDDLLR